jgi:plasmid stabilization system protein ParE
MTYRISKEAKQDLRDIWEYIAEDNPNAADATIETIYKAIRKLV